MEKYIPGGFSKGSIILVVAILIVAAFLIGGGIVYYSAGKLPAMPQVIQQNMPMMGSRTLNLSSQGLTQIPSYVFNQTNLEELNVSHNALTGAIQAEIRHLSHLKVLNASYNNMTGVPAEIGQLQNLEVLDLSYNQLTGLPNELGNLQNLKTLNLKGNSYSQQDLEGIRSKLPPTVTIITN